MHEAQTQISRHGGRALARSVDAAELGRYRELHE
jgi:hypothetical protein